MVPNNFPLYLDKIVYKVHGSEIPRQLLQSYGISYKQVYKQIPSTAAAILYYSRRNVLDLGSRNVLLTARLDTICISSSYSTFILQQHAMKVNWDLDVELCDSRPQNGQL
jgi:hypothetical protein